MKKKKEWISIVIAFLGSLLGCYGVLCFNMYVVMRLPLVTRMICMIVFYWLIALIPVIVMKKDGDRLKDYGFKREKTGLQILVGTGIGIAMSLVLTVIPHLAGFGAYVSSGKNYRYAWQFIYEFVYCICGVAAVEELVFRGIIYGKIKRTMNKEAAAIIGSSMLFGLFHIFNGNIIQIVLTACLGAIWSVCRLKIKNCSTLSLIIAHGVYDALITVWACVFMR